MALKSVIFRKKIPHIFSDINPSNFLICKFEYFKQLFSLQNLETTYYEPFLPISTVFQFLIKLFSIGLKVHIELYGNIFSVAVFKPFRFFF